MLAASIRKRLGKGLWSCPLAATKDLAYIERMCYILYIFITGCSFAVPTSRFHGQHRLQQKERHPTLFLFISNLISQETASQVA